MTNRCIFGVALPAPSAITTYKRLRTIDTLENTPMPFPETYVNMGVTRSNLITVWAGKSKHRLINYTGVLPIGHYTSVDSLIVAMYKACTQMPIKNVLSRKVDLRDLLSITTDPLDDTCLNDHESDQSPCGHGVAVSDHVPWCVQHAGLHT